MVVGIANQTGLYSFLILVPFILLYLIRPRPQKMNIPSLMFFFTTREKKRKSSFFRNFVNDLLFLIQLIIFLLLCMQLTEPYQTYMHDITAQNTVLVIDVSASSQVRDGGTTRFARAIDKAKDLVGSSNTIILAKEVPQIALEGVSGGEAIRFLSELKPLDTSSKIGDAIILAGEIMNGKEGRVVVLSDFINTDGTPPGIAADILQTRDIVVDLINTATGNPVSNIGIVDLTIDEKTTTVYIKNYNTQPEQVTVSISNLQKQLTISPQSIEPFAFTTPEKVTKVTLDVNDDFSVDNVAYLSAPSKEELSVNVVSENLSIFLKSTIESTPQTVFSHSIPPIIEKEHDVYVFHEVSPSKILPGTFEDLRKRIENDGVSLIIYAFPEIAQIDFKGLIPVDILQRASGAPLVTEQVNRFTKNIDFGSVEQYFLATPKEGAISIISARNSTIVAVQRLGAGKIVYYGIMDESSDFKFSPAYPIFWKGLLEFIMNKQSVQNLNAKVGDTLILEKSEKITFPNGRNVNQGTLIYEQQGIYQIGDRAVAVNLVDEKESAIAPTEIIGATASKAKLQPITEEREFEWELPLLAGACIFLFIELLYIKFRGDI